MRNIGHEEVTAEVGPLRGWPPGLGQTGYPLEGEWAKEEGERR